MRIIKKSRKSYVQKDIQREKRDMGGPEVGKKSHKYKAVVIDINIVKKRIGFLALSVAAIGAVIFCADKLWANKTIAYEDISQSIIDSSSPIIKSVAGEKSFLDNVKFYIDKTAKLFLGFIPGDTESIINSVLPICSAETEGRQNIYPDNKDTKTPEDDIRDKTNTSDKTSVEFAKSQSYGEGRQDKKSKDIPEGNRAPIKSIDAAQKSENSIGNETSYNIDVGALLAQKPDIDMSISGPKILITHTHATEAYADSENEFYDVTASDRNRDSAANVVAVGEAMSNTFKANGIEVIHDTVLHDEPSFNGSYAHSLAQIEEYLKKYSSIQIVFDVHRDSIVYGDKTKAKTVTNIEGESAAQLMFVVGTNEKGLYNPDWKYNLSAALNFQNAIYQKYPSLMRHINLRRERFNGHTSHASMIIETGTSGNTLEEAKYSICLAAECISDYLKSL